jgi:hypothetical protein
VVGKWQRKSPTPIPLLLESTKAAVVKEDESHGDRVAADAPFRVGLQIPSRSSCCCSQRGKESTN